MRPTPATRPRITPGVRRNSAMKFNTISTIVPL
jgi:hypothetical protein